MFIIFGSPRSGTTLLAESISLHSKLLVKDQSDYIIPSAFIFNRIKNKLKRKKLINELILNSNLFEKSLGKVINKFEIKEILKEEKIFNSFSGFMSALFEKVQIKNKLIHYGDKSVSDIGFINILDKENFFNSNSDFKFIHIVRDPRAVISSIENLGWLRGKINAYPRSWSNSNLYLNELLINKKNYLFLRYEDFVSQYSSTMKKICDFLEVENSKDFSNHNNRGSIYNESYHSRLFEKVDDKRINSWKNEIKPSTLEICNRDTVHARKVFGYKVN